MAHNHGDGSKAVPERRQIQFVVGQHPRISQTIKHCAPTNALNLQSQHEERFVHDEATAGASLIAPSYSRGTRVKQLLQSPFPHTGFSPPLSGYEASLSAHEDDVERDEYIQETSARSRLTQFPSVNPDTESYYYEATCPWNFLSCHDQNEMANRRNGSSDEAESPSTLRFLLSYLGDLICHPADFGRRCMQCTQGSPNDLGHQEDQPLLKPSPFLHGDYRSRRIFQGPPAYKSIPKPEMRSFSSPH